jgi:hypothetical protein
MELALSSEDIQTLLPQTHDAEQEGKGYSTVQRKGKSTRVIPTAGQSWNPTQSSASDSLSC